MKRTGKRTLVLFLAAVMLYGSACTVLAEEEPSQPVQEQGNIQVIRQGTGDGEPLLAMEISDEKAAELGERLQTARRSYLSQGEDAVSLLDCGSSYGYEDMTKRSNGENRQYLYHQAEEESREFTLSAADAEILDGMDEICYMAAAIDLTDYPLSAMEKVESYFTFRNDNPQYFWLSNMVVYSDDWVFLLTYGAYREGSVRAEAFREISDTAQTVYCSGIQEKDSSYRKTRKIHDALIGDVEYAPDTQVEIYHSVAGAMTSERLAVCEGYAKVMQLMLNYYGIPNIYVTGYAGGAHAWNLVQMADGNYYWLDATWDDHEEDVFQHQYFLVGNQNFSDHDPDRPDGTGTFFLYELPIVPDTDYEAPLLSILPDEPEISAVKGQKGVLTYRLDPEGTTDPETVTFSSEQPEIVSVDPDTGAWEALQPGTARILLKGYGGVKAQVTITVEEISVSRIQLSRSELTLKPGTEARLTAVLLPDHHTDENGTITWESSDEQIVTVQPDGEGAVRIRAAKQALAGQSATITATAWNGVSAECRVSIADWIRGDVNEDGQVDISDLRLLLRSVCKKVTLTDSQMKAADVTDDGTADIQDLRKVLRFVCHKIDQL